MYQISGTFIFSGESFKKITVQVCYWESSRIRTAFCGKLRWIYVTNRKFSINVHLDIDIQMHNIDEKDIFYWELVDIFTEHYCFYTTFD